MLSLTIVACKDCNANKCFIEIEIEMEKTTNTLTEILKKTDPERIEEYFAQNADEVLSQHNPFGTYLRACAKERGLRLQEIFLQADISEGYGYKLVSGEKHTRQRDTILRLCLGTRLSLEETQRALKIYGMSPLYARYPRDAVLISAISAGRTDIEEIDRVLAANHLKQIREQEKQP